MASMRSYQITEFGGAVSEAILDVPEPHGTEVLIKVTHAGVCHSDLHIADGYYDLGAGAKLPWGTGASIYRTPWAMKCWEPSSRPGRVPPRRRSGLPGWCIPGSAAWNIPNVSTAAKTIV